jgi:hypothetical protein
LAGYRLDRLKQDFAVRPAICVPIDMLPFSSTGLHVSQLEYGYQLQQNMRDVELELH